MFGRRPRSPPRPRGAPGPRGRAEALSASGWDHALDAARLLVDFRGGALLRRLDATATRRLQLLLPELIASLSAEDDRLAMLRRFLRVIEAIGARSAYFALLNETPTARRRSSP